MDCVVRTDQEIRTGALEHLRGPEHQLANLFPIVRQLNRLHIFGQRDGVHRQFRMHMPAHQRLRFQTYRPIAESRSFCAATNNPNMLCHARKSICCIKRSFFSTGRNDASMELRASSRRWSSVKLNSCFAISNSLFSDVWNIAGSSVLKVIISPSSKNFLTGCSCISLHAPVRRLLVMQISIGTCFCAITSSNSGSLAADSPWPIRSAPIFSAPQTDSGPVVSPA